MMELENIRQEFPALAESVYGKPLVYLDNAATSQRPSSVTGKLFPEFFYIHFQTFWDGVCKFKKLIFHLTLISYKFV